MMNLELFYLMEKSIGIVLVLEGCLKVHVAKNSKMPSLVFISGAVEPMSVCVCVCVCVCLKLTILHYREHYNSPELWDTVDFKYHHCFVLVMNNLLYMYSQFVSKYYPLGSHI